MALRERPPLTLHIGYPRTATKAFQTALDTLNPDIKFLGRTTTGKGPQRWRCPSIHPYWEWARWGKNGTDLREARRQVEAILDQAGRDGMAAAVISDETMCKPQRFNWHPGLVRRLRDLFPEARILLTLRNQVDIVASLYGLYLRRSLATGTPVAGFSEWYLHGAGSSYVPLTDRFNFLSLYQPLAEAFGGENIAILTYEEFTADPGAYLRRLARVFGCESFAMPVDEVVNPSPALDMRLKRKLAQGLSARLYRYGRLNPIFPLLDWLSGATAVSLDGLVAHEDARRVISYLFAESNDDFAELAGIDLAGLGYPSKRTRPEYYATD